jgi:hypothetical protein
MKKIIYILFLFLILCPYVGQGQDDPYDPYSIDYIGDDDLGESGSETITEDLFNKVLRSAFNDDHITIYLDLYGKVPVFDMMGNYLRFGKSFWRFNHTQYSENVANVYGGRWGRELKELGIDIKNFKFQSMGIQFLLFDAMHTIRAGTLVPLFFTPLTIKKLKLFGMRYDLEKEDVFKFKGFATTRFKEDVYSAHEGGVPIQDDDKVMYAGRVTVNPKANNYYLGASYINNKLRNGFYTDEGIKEDFLKNYMHGDLVAKSENYYGIDFQGDTGSIKFNAEYVYNLKDYYTVNKHTNYVGPTNVPYINSSTKSSKMQDSALVLSIQSKDILVDILKQPRFSLFLNGWYMGADYGARWAMDDDDDGWLDDSLLSDDPFFPYELDDNAQNDEPQAGVIYRQHNKNMNATPDYEEDFLLFYTDYYFTGTMVEEDANHNGIIDREENDLDPDYFYDLNRQGTMGILVQLLFNLVRSWPEDPTIAWSL